jgi:arabinose-5-phosphate isomerase
MEDFLAEAPDLLRLQAQAILDAADRLDPDGFRTAVDLLLDCQGKVLVSGAGTSGVIARKVAATLTSTGTAAVFLHPADALHGALGIVTSDDVAILISNSGETDEILVLLPYLEYRKVPLISLTGNLQSTLARRSTVAIDARAEKEACPLNLAPTSSTSVALAMADTLAMTVMKAKKVTPEAFALNHPSGRLGKRLTLRVQDVMHGGPELPVAFSDEPWLEVVTRISRCGLGAVVVTDEEDGPIQGIITDGDVRRTVLRTEPSRLNDLRARDIMTKRPITVQLGSLAYAALQVMENRESQIGVLPVVDETARCVGLVRLHDLVRSGM